MTAHGNLEECSSVYTSKLYMTRPCKAQTARKSSICLNEVLLTF